MNINVERELTLIKSRNKRVELDKAWETSWTRKVVLSIMTYIVMCTIFYIIDVKDFYINAVVPTAGFFLSTLSLGIIKNQWIKRQKD